MATGVAPDGTQVAEFVLKQPPSGPPVDLDAVFRAISTSVSLPTPPVDGASVASIAAPCAGDLDGDGMVGG